MKRTIERVTGRSFARASLRPPSASARRADMLTTASSPTASVRPRERSEIMTEYARPHPDRSSSRSSAIAAMLAEAFRQPGERMPIAGLGLIGLVGAGDRVVLALEQRCAQLRRHPSPTTSRSSSTSSSASSAC